MAYGFKVQCDECNIETVTQRCLWMHLATYYMLNTEENSPGSWF